MGWISGILTFILVVICLFLSLLILAQKPKKDTGGGLAFGGAATDALFGAGSGDLFTKMTKYCTVIFFVLVLVLSVLSAQQSRHRASDPRLRVSTTDKQEMALPAATPPPAAATTPSPTSAAPVAASTSAPAASLLLSKTNLLSTPTPTPAPPPPTNSAPKPATNPAPKPEAEKK